MTSELLPTQNVRITATVKDDVATITEQSNTSSTKINVPEAALLSAVLETMFMPETTPFFCDAFSVAPEDASAKIESPPYSGRAVYVPWRFIAPLISDLNEA